MTSGPCMNLWMGWALPVYPLLVAGSPFLYFLVYCHSSSRKLLPTVSLASKARGFLTWLSPAVSNQARRQPYLLLRLGTRYQYVAGGDWEGFLLHLDAPEQPDDKSRPASLCTRLVQSRVTHLVAVHSPCFSISHSRQGRWRTWCPRRLVSSAD